MSVIMVRGSPQVGHSDAVEGLIPMPYKEAIL
jgi:hypothetical protein